ncbi:winged helix-turn-helix domain-containing protein [Enterococcus devriesei]|uniref:winged helix-turn-helix domain-containing protein n=1 Tax=Enterococcus devriesei TaxID=319970 RepID=UPI0036D305A7
MNRDWRKLKHSANGVPTNDSLLPYVLEVLKDDIEVHKKVVIERVIEFLQIPETILAEKYPESQENEGIMIDRFGWALSSLYIADLVQRPRRGVYKITESGLTMLDQYGDRLTKKDL